MEDSDGISVISESEMFKNNQTDDEVTSNENTLVEEATEDEKEKKLELLTPPATPKPCTGRPEPCTRKSEDQWVDDFTRQKLQIYATLLSVCFVVFTYMYLARPFRIIELENIPRCSWETRILQLEKENLELKTQIEHLQMRLKAKNEIKFEEEEKFRQPITKDVWLGEGNDDVVKILDNKFHSITDYCYADDESDLFFEYNKENCERKKQKLDERVEKFYRKSENHAESVDDIYKPTRDVDYDNFMTQTTEELMASLHDEIQEIKRNRMSAVNFEENQGKSKKKRKRKNKKKKQCGKGEDEWIDLRSAGREEARNKVDKEENWYLKRKNDREIHRLEASNVF